MEEREVYFSEGFVRKTYKDEDFYSFRGVCFSFVSIHDIFLLIFLMFLKAQGIQTFLRAY